MKLLVLVLTFLSDFTPNSFSEDLNILKPGAIPDSITLNTEIIRSAIDRISEKWWGNFSQYHCRFQEL